MSEKTRNDHIDNKNAPDPTAGPRQETMADHFERARELYEAHGSSVTFQLFRINLRGNTIAELQGAKLAEFTMSGDAISGDDTVAMVREKVRPSLQDKLQEGDQITLLFGGRPMREDALFYGDHFMVFPVWIQVLLHDCEFRNVESAIRRIKRTSTLPPPT